MNTNITYALFTYSSSLPVLYFLLLNKNIHNEINGSTSGLTQAVGCRNFKAEIPFQSRASLCGTCGMKRGTVICFPPNISVFPVGIIPPTFHTLLIIYHLRSSALATGIAFN